MKKRLKMKRYLDCDDRFYVVNKSGDILGDIYFYTDWNQWIFEPEIATIYSWDCLCEISEMVKNAD